MNAYHDHDHDPEDRDDAPTRDDPPPRPARDRCYFLDDGDCKTLVVYDGENELAWVQSTVWVEFGG